MTKSTGEIKSVLVHVGLDRLGDGLLKLPFMRGLKTAFPDVHVTWFAGKETTVYARSLKPLAQGLVDEVIEYGGIGDSPKELFGPRPLKDRHFDLVIDTQRNFWIALGVRRIRHRQFVSPAARFLLSTSKPKRGYKFPKAMQRQLLDLLEIASNRTFETPAVLALDIPSKYRDAAQRLLPVGTRYAAFAPGSGGRPKCWPLDRFIDVAKAAGDAGVTPVFLIGPQEEEWINTIRNKLPSALLPLQAEEGRAFNYDPMLSIALGERLAAALSNDSGIAHMLAVAGTPLVVMYGPTVYEKFPPMSNDVTVIRAETFGSREMSAIPVDAVRDALLAQLAKAPAS
ncbi:MAG: glycosyltransferase family 9 protein [Rhodospirillales bacterium]|nr:glycosyltransferase family 9 protein [Rhodospirillales bacterium]MBO6787572.1 glycosyltransferase family 9 protein [Rhodospirillales bacterium]